MITYRPGTVVVLRVRFMNRGEPVDPDQVHLILNAPNKGRHGRRDKVLAYGRDAELIRSGPGQYRAEIETCKTGEYFYRWAIGIPRECWHRFAVAEPER